MGASKNDFIDDAFFNSHFIEDGEDACGSFETEEAMRRCYLQEAEEKEHELLPLPTKED